MESVKLGLRDAVDVPIWEREISKVKTVRNIYGIDLERRYLRAFASSTFKATTNKKHNNDAERTIVR